MDKGNCIVGYTCFYYFGYYLEMYLRSGHALFDLSLKYNDYILLIRSRLLFILDLKF